MLLFALFLCVTLSKAQNLGDYMEIDNIPGFVFYLDETGEHGLVMSYPAVSQEQAKKIDKKIKKMASKGKIPEGIPEEKIKASERLRMAGPSKSISFKEKKKLYEDLLPLLTSDGEKNAEIIADYCKNKNILIQDYFPNQHWASQLGNGWFIPGEKEVTLFAKFYTGGVGKEHKITGLTGFLDQGKKLSNDKMVQVLLTGLASTGILSSCMKNISGGFCGLHIVRSKSLAFSSWLVFDDQFTEVLNNVAIHKF